MGATSLRRLRLGSAREWSPPSLVLRFRITFACLCRRWSTSVRAACAELCSKWTSSATSSPTSTSRRRQRSSRRQRRASRCWLRDRRSRAFAARMQKAGTTSFSPSLAARVMWKLLPARRRRRRNSRLASARRWAFCWKTRWLRVLRLHPRVALHLAGPFEKAHQLPSLAPAESPEFQETDALHLQSCVGLNAPAQVGAAPRRQV